MRALVFLILLAFAAPVFAQTGRPEVTVATVADAIARGARTNEVLIVQNYSTNVSWPAPRTFIARTTSSITNAHDGVHYLTNQTAGLVYTSLDRFAAEQDASWWGAAGDSVTDDTIALNAASAYTARYIDESSYTTLKGPGRGFLRIRPTTTGYMVTNTVYLQSSTEASGAAIIYRGQKTNSVALAVGPTAYTTTFINNHTFNLPDVWGYNDGFSAAGSIGVSLRSIGRSTIRMGYVYRFETGIQLLGDTGYFALNKVDGGKTDACRYSLTLLATNSGFVNGNTWSGIVMNNENGNFAPGADTGYELIKIDGTGGSINGNVWQGGSFEGFPGQRVIYIKNASANLFTGQRWEHHVGDYTNVVASKLYMEVESTIVGNGLNNRVVWLSQGINGMAGIFVKETPVGQAIGNSGASSDWQEYRSSDTGDYHGPIVLTSSSTTNQGLGHITTYPYIAWPDTHFSLYTNWGSMLTGNGYRFKSPTNPVAQLYIENSGEIIQAAAGTLSFVPRWKAQDGTLYFYNDSSQITMQVNRAGSLQFFNPSTAISQGSIRSDYSGFFGGLVYSGAPTNTLGGITLSQYVDRGSLGWAGVDIVGYDNGGANYLEMAVGTFSTNHPYGAMQNGSGIWINSSATSLNNDHFTIALVPTNTDFRVVLGNTQSPSLGVDRDTVSGDTRLRVWVANSNAPVRLRHDDIAKLLYTGASLNTNIAAIASSTGGSAGQVLSFVNATTFAWSNAPSSFSFSDLTNALLMGSNMSAVYTSSNMTISSSGGGGATNGTSVSVDGGVALGSANFADSSKVGFSASGTNVTATIVADSLALADIDATTETHFLNRTNHTGTQAWSTLHTTPTTLSGYGITDAQPLDADLTRIAAVTWATGDFVYRDGTGLTNFASTSAGRALLAAADAAAQRTALGLGDMALYNDAPTNANAYVRSNGTWAIAGTGGGSGTVTSVGLTVPSGFSVSGSPVTTSGTLAISGILATNAGGTGITNTTAAGQALLAAADAAAQRAALELGTMALKDDAPTNANAYVRSNGTWAIASSGGSGTAVLVNGTNVSNPNFRQFFGITDSTNVDLLLSAGTNVTFSTNGGVLTIAATPGSTFTTNYLTVPIFAASTTNVVSNSNTTETNILNSIASWGSTNLSANTLASGTVLRLRAGGMFTTTGNWDGGTFRFKVGGLTVSATFDDPESYAPSNKPWTLDVALLVESSGASATVAVSGGLTYEYVGIAATLSGVATVRPLSFSGTLDTTAANTVGLTFQNTSGQEITLIRNTATLEWVGKETILGGGSGSGGGTTNIVSTSTNGLVPQITVSNAVFMSSSTGVPEWHPNRTTKTIATFRAQQGEPPTSSYSTFSTRNGIGTLLYDEAVFTSTRFRWMVPEGYNLTNVTIIVKWTTSATSGDGTWVVKNAKLTGDIDSLSFGTPVTNTVTTSATAGTVMTSTLTGVSAGSPSAGDWIYTDVARIDDSINSNDLELHAVEVRSE